MGYYYWFYPSYDLEWGITWIVTGTDVDILRDWAGFTRLYDYIATEEVFWVLMSLSSTAKRKLSYPVSEATIFT